MDNVHAESSSSSGAHGRLWRLGLFVLVVAVVAGACAVTYREVWNGDRDRLSGRYDVYRSAGPLAYLMDHCIQSGEFPFWNPLTLCGMPYLANPVTGMLYPFNLVRSLLTVDPTPLKSQTGMVIMMAFHLVLCGVGMVYLARAHGLSLPGACAAAFIFIFSAVWVRRVSEYHFITMVGWLPWLLLLTRAAMRQPDLRVKLAYGLGGGLIFGSTLLTGAFNVAPYMAVTISGYGLLYRLTHPATGVRGPGMRGMASLVASDAFFGVLLFICAALVAMALLLPGAELAGLSSRVKGSGQTLMIPHYAGTWRQLYEDLLRYPGTRFEVENIRGAGVAALLLAAAGLVSVRRRAVALCALLFLILFDLSMGPPLPLSRLFYNVMPIQMIASTRAFDFALIPLALLAGLGLDAVTAPVNRPFWVALRSVALLGLGFLLLRDLKPLLGMDFLPVDRWALFLPGAALLAAVTAGWFPLPGFWRTLLCGLVLLETLVWTSKYVPYLVYADEYAQRASKKYSTEFWASNRRGLDYFQNRSLYELRGVMHGYEPVYIEQVRNTLADDVRGKSYQRSVKAYEISEGNHRGLLFLKRQFWLARQYAAGPLPGKHELFPAATTVFLDDPGSLPVPRVDREQAGTSSISTAPDGTHGRELNFVSEAALTKLQAGLAPGRKDRTIYLPDAPVGGVHSTLVLVLSANAEITVRPRFAERGTDDFGYGKVTQVRPAAEADVTVELPVPDYEVVRTRILFQCPRGNTTVALKRVYLLQDTQDEGRLLRVVFRTANQVALEVQDLPGPRILTFLDAFYPGWTARVDGMDAPILRANDAFKAVVLPAGSHRIEFAYRPRRAYLGIGITAATVAASVITMIALTFRARRGGVPT